MPEREQTTRPPDRSAGPQQVPRATVEKGLKSRGESLDESAVSELAPGYAPPFTEVRIHRDDTAAESAAALDATAFTWGNHVVFGAGAYAPGTAAGKDLLRHELAHVAQTRGREHPLPAAVEVAAPGTWEETAAESAARAPSGPAPAPAPPRVYRKIVPEDVATEMVGRTMLLSSAFTATPVIGPPVGPPSTFPVAAGSTVEVTAWNNTLPTARVQLVGPVPNTHVPFDVPKTFLRPTRSSAGLSPYDAGLAAQVATVERGERSIATEKARPGGPRPGEVPRLEGLQVKRQELLNKRLIQETMFNRFDPSIKKWVDHYTKTFPQYKPPLDPNLVKAMLFQESQMGTSGQHLEDPPSHPVRSRFNVGQVIDSSALALLTMIEENAPALVTTHHLGSMRTDLALAQGELATLNKKASRTPAEDSRRAALQAGSKRSWEIFLWAYKAPGRPTGFADAVKDFFAAPSGGVARHLDYDFWIQAAVRWLFEKRKTTSSWADAIRAYNGSGASAVRYRDSVVKRAADASAAQKAKKDFVPGKI